MTSSATDLDRIRWDWSRQAIARLRADLRGLDDAGTEHTDLAHVMVIGDTQVGKTSLLLRLLGVTDPELTRQAAEPLRGGRDRGKSATSVPIRYQWSGDQNLWSLVHGPQRQMDWLSSTELATRMAEFRDGDRLRWDPADRPLEIGLPSRLAGRHPRQDVRVFDLPGLYAAGAQEQDVARRLIAEYAPVMNFVILVLSGDQFAEQLLSPTITDNQFLCTWGEQPERFQLVFTRAFSNARVRRYLADELAPSEPPVWDPDRVLRLVREYFDAQLAGSGLPHGRTDVLFPVEIGDTWQELSVDGTPNDTNYAAGVTTTNDRLFDELGRIIVGFSDESSAHLAAPEIARRIQVMVRANRRRRQDRIDRAEAMLAAAEQTRAESEAVARKAAEQLVQATARAAALQTGLDQLRELQIEYVRPPAPELEGPRVRAAQEQERAAWATAAHSSWDRWRAGQDRDPASPVAFPIRPPGDLDAGIRAEYDRLCGCCHGCEDSAWLRFWRDTNRPQDCYARMTAVEPRPWIRATLHRHAAPTVAAAQERQAKAERKSALARTVLMSHQAKESAARQQLAGVIAETSREDDDDRHNLRVADSVRARLEQANAEFVQSLLEQADIAVGDERAALFLAALRGADDLDRMFRR